MTFPLCPPGVRLHVPSERSVKQDPRVDVVLALLQQSDQFDRFSRRAATVVNLSDSRLRHLVAQVTGVPLTSHIMRARLSRAAALLTQGHLSIKEIAAVSGFKQPSHFCKRFKFEFGQSPSDFRSASHHGRPADPDNT